MIWEEIYRASLICMGEDPENPIFFSTAIAALQLTAVQLIPLLRDVCKSRGKEEMTVVRPTSLQEECPFPRDFFAILVYGLCSVLLQHDDAEQAKSYAVLCNDACTRLRRALPAISHPIVDCYQ